MQGPQMKIEDIKTENVKSPLLRSMHEQFYSARMPKSGSDAVRLIGPITKAFGELRRFKHIGITRTGQVEDKRRRDVLEVALGYAATTESDLMEVIEELSKNYEQAASLWKDYEKRLTEFRSAVKNDVTSLEAAARKTTDAVHRMNAAYGHVITQLNSQEMQQALSNAERLAAAMQALASLQSHRLVLSVTEQDKTI
jgi:ribosomal protein L20